MSVDFIYVSSREPTEVHHHYPEFLNSLAKFGITGLNVGEDQPWHGLMSKPFIVRNWLRAGGSKTGRVLFVDAWDVVMQEHPDSIDARCRERFGDAIVFNGEGGAWPLTTLDRYFPDTGPMRFLNGGVICGPAHKLLAMYEYMRIEQIGYGDPIGGQWRNDQEAYQLTFCDQPVDMTIDTRCEIFQMMHGQKFAQFDFSGEHVRNIAMNTTPGIFHFAGVAKHQLVPFCKRRGIPTRFDHVEEELPGANAAL